MKNTQEKLSQFRNYMAGAGFDAFVIPSNDPHFGEYVQDYYKCREWLSGFSGSAGTLVVTLFQAALWTDSRYFLQAARELDGSGIELMKMKESGTPTIPEWLLSVLQPGSIVGADESLIPVSEYNGLVDSISPLVLTLTGDPFSVVWTDRPPIFSSLARTVNYNVSGEASASKLNRACETLGLDGDFYCLLSSCDDIAWLCNLRGADVPYNPLLYSYLLFGRGKAELFVSGNSADSSVQETLSWEGISIREYSQINSYLKNLDPAVPVVMPYGKTSMRMFNSLKINRGAANIMDDTTPGGVAGSLKAVKNPIEIDGFRKAMVNDGVAWVRFIMELEKRLANTSARPYEHELSELLIKKRSENPDYLGESFAPIVAFGPNGAQPHYSPSSANPCMLGLRGFLLIDTGAHYPYGTTDTTRTFFLGEPNREECLDYTAVLKGMISLSMVLFPPGTRGASLDILARGEVYKRGKRYMHGTGHGVGHNLCVHEGPQSIRMEENPVTFRLGMVTSNEPAIYQEGEYGIRIENLLCCGLSDNVAGFYCFETLTLIPVDTKAVDVAFLGEECTKWLNGYHRRVYETLAPQLNHEEKVWLSEKTSEIGG